VLTGLVYDARVRLHFATFLIVAVAQFAMGAGAQEDASIAKSNNEKSSHGDNSKSEPKYDETFSGQIVEFTATQITVSRSILGKPAEKCTFAIKSDTRIEGKLRAESQRDYLAVYRKSTFPSMDLGAKVENLLLKPK
jgi:hypothetical protein